MLLSNHAFKGRGGEEKKKRGERNGAAACVPNPQASAGNAMRGRKGAEVPKEGHPHTHKRVAFQCRRWGGGGRPDDIQRATAPALCKKFLAQGTGPACCHLSRMVRVEAGKSVISHEGEAEARGWNSGSPGGGGEGGEAPVQQEPERERPNLQLS